jgi:predicted lipid carrier protein YhbT
MSMTAATQPSLTHSPTLPRLLTAPLGLVPARLNSAVLARILNRVLKPELADGELDFLDGRVMLIHVDDARLRFRLTLRHGRIEPAKTGTSDDLSIEGSTYEFLLLATRREDPDTLFFNRRLRLGGNTELGLYVKNLLDSLELEDRLGPLLTVMNRAADLMARFAGKRA